MAALGQASTSSPAGSSQSTTTEYVVRAPSSAAKKYSMIKFSTGTNIDFLKLTNTSVKMERQNNLREYKTAHNIDTMPKFGAGSEYGRDLKEEARRKKFGINVKNYNPDDQPWLMKVGKGKDGKRFKGVREGTITENTSYYIFTQCADGAFDAYPVEEWYNFQPIVNYKYLNSEEAEEEFSRRDKTMNLFSIMVKKRIRNEDDTTEVDESEKKEKTKAKKDKSLILTDMEDWVNMSDDDDEEEDEEANEDGEKKPKKEKKKDKKKKKGRKNAKINDNDEAVEESDEGDFDDRELDYITDSGSESDMDEKAKEDKYDDKGVDQEQGLKKILDSEEESSEDENEKKDDEDAEEEEQEAQTEKKSKKKKKETNEAGGDESDSSSSSSESDDSDIEKNEGKFSSVLFMQKKKGSSRSTTPTMEKSGESSKTESKPEGLKRKVEIEDSPEQPKKMRTDSPVTSAAALAISSGEITEEAIRRYLMRKPMTAKELVQKFKSKKPQMSKEQMTQKIAQLLKKINPDRKFVNNTLYLSVNKTE